MARLFPAHRNAPWLWIAVAAAIAVAAWGAAASADDPRTSRFTGAKVNRGTVTYSIQDGQRRLTLSEDFELPQTPDPHWQVVDSEGHTWLLQRLTIKDDQVNRSIVVPAHVPDVSKVQMWCAFAEVLLGEGTFAQPVR